MFFDSNTTQPASFCRKEVIAVRKTLIAVVGALLVLSTNPSPASAATSRSPVLMPDGTYRMDVSVLQVDYSQQLLITNLSGGTITVMYGDASYGNQATTLSSVEGVPLCADINYRESSPVTVIFNPGTPNEVTGTATFGTIVSTLPQTVTGDLDHASSVLQKARTKLKSARKALRQAKARHNQRAIRVALRKVRVAKSGVADAKQAKALAVSAYTRLQAEKQFCQGKHL